MCSSFLKSLIWGKLSKANIQAATEANSQAATVEAPVSGHPLEAEEVSVVGAGRLRE